MPVANPHVNQVPAFWDRITHEGLKGKYAHADITFTPVPFAADDASRRVPMVSASAMVNGAEVPLAYHAFARSGDMKGPVPFGQLLMLDGKPVVGAISSNPDFTSLLPKGDKLYSVTQFEEAPGGLMLSELSHDADGNLTVISSKPIDTSKVGGIWQPCAGSVTAWGTHLGSEEYPDNARITEDAKELKDLEEDTPAMARLFGLDPAAMTLDQFRAAFNPYKYGFATEISVSDAGDASIVKHYSCGRLSMEMAMVMPDKKTAYISNDGTNVALYRYVADKEGDLTEMRRHIMPIVEAGGVDLVLTGHSHTYERSMFMDGAYATPTVSENVILDDGDGDPAGDGAYRKTAGLNARSISIRAAFGSRTSVFSSWLSNQMPPQPRQPSSGTSPNRRSCADERG